MSNSFTISKQTEKLLVEQFIKQYGTNALHTNIPEKKLINAAATFGIDKNQISAMYDLTLFGSGKDCIIITTEFIGFKDSFASLLRFDYKSIVTNLINDYEKTMDSLKNYLADIKLILLQKEQGLYTYYKQQFTSKLQKMEQQIFKAREYSGESFEELGLVEQLQDLNARIVMEDELKATATYQLAIAYVHARNFDAAFAQMEAYKALNNQLIQPKLVNQLDVTYRTMVKADLMDDVYLALIENKFKEALEAVTQLQETGFIPEQEMKGLRKNILSQYAVDQQRKIKLKIDSKGFTTAFDMYTELVELEALNAQQQIALFEQIAQPYVEEQTSKFHKNLQYKKFDEAQKYYDEMLQKNVLTATNQAALEKAMTEAKEKEYIRVIQRFTQNGDFTEAYAELQRLSQLNSLAPHELQAYEVQITTAKETKLQHLHEELKQALSSENSLASKNAINEIETIDAQFNIVEEKIQFEILENNFDNAAKLAQQLQEMDTKETLQNLIHAKRESVSASIMDSILEKEYAVLDSNPQLLYTKDILQMTPLMYFALLNDRKCFEFYAEPIQTAETNIFGQTIYDLLAWNADQEFMKDFICIFNEDGIAIAKKINNLTKLIGSSEKSLNFLDKVSSVAGATKIGLMADSIGIKSSEELMNKENRLYAHYTELKELIASLTNNKYQKQERHLKLLFNSNSIKNDAQCSIEKMNIQIEKIQEKIYQLQQQDTKVKDVMDENILNNLKEVVIEALGEKDEFETTAEYNERLEMEMQRRIAEKDASVHEVLSTQSEENALKNEELIQQYKEEIAQLQHQNEPNLNLFGAVEWLMKEENEQKFYQLYYTEQQQSLHLEKYDADTETFQFTYLGDSMTCAVPRSIARQFKEQFYTLPKRFVKEMKNNKVYTTFFITFEEQVYTVSFLNGALQKK